MLQFVGFVENAPCSMCEQRASVILSDKTIACWSCLALIATIENECQEVPDA